MLAKIRKFYDEWILVPHRRYRLFNGISLILVIFSGFTSIYPLWIFNGCLCYRETNSRKLKVFYAVMIVILSILFAIGLYMHINILLQYFGYFI